MIQKKWPVLGMIGFWILWPAVLMAQDEQPVLERLEGSVTVGGAGVVVDKESFKFGEYTGVDDTGGYFLGDTNLTYTQGNYFADILIDNLGLDNRKVYFEAGQYGNFSSFVEFDQQRHLLSNTGTTSYQGVGSTTLTGGSTTGTFRSFDQDTDRKAVQFGFKKTLGKEKEFIFSFRREEKKGIKDLAATFGFANASILPEAVDQVTNEMRASLTHSGEKIQIKMDYFLSLFENKNQSIFFNSPFAAGPGAGDNGLISTNPDNTYHKVSLSGGMNFSHSGRVSAIAEYGRMSQDEKLLGFSVNPAAVITTPVPRQTADAEIHTIHLSLRGSARPLPKLSVGAKYKFYKTINDTPKQQFLYIPLDGTTQNAITAANALFTQPYDYMQNKVNFFAVYRVPLDTTLKLDYGIDWFNRDLRAVENTVEQTIKGSARSDHLEILDIHVHTEFANRRGDEYNPNRVFNGRHSAEFLALGGTFDVFPDLARSDIANRKRVKAGGDLNFFPGHNTTVGVSYNFLNDEYPNTTLGFTESRNHNVSIDAAYADKYESYYVYYSFDDVASRQNGRVTNADLNTNWRAFHDDETHTVGVGGKWGFMHNKLWVGGDYSFSKTISDISFQASPGAVALVTPVPDIQTTLHTLKISADYQYEKGIDIGLKYKLQGYEADNFFTDGVAPNTLSNVLFLGGSNPDYLAHIALVYVTYHFGGRY